MNFSDAYQTSGLQACFAAGQINFSEDNAKLIVQESQLENINPVVCSVRWRSEAFPSFDIWAVPDTNSKDKPGNLQDYTQWDIGPGQPNWHWYHKAVSDGLIKVDDLPDSEVFGTVFFNPDGSPAKFNGVPLSNLRACDRYQLAIHVHGCDKDTGLIFRHADEERSVMYTGIPHRARRLEIYRFLEPPLAAFFAAYQPTNPVPASMQDHGA